MDLNSRSRDHVGMGVVLCLFSAACFGALGVFGKLAYDDGVGPLTLLSVRFGLAAVVFAALLAVRPGDRRRLPARTLLTALALGAVGYAAQAGLFFAALERMDVSLLSLLLYTYPAFVTIVALALGRERATPRRLVALAAASAGVALVLAGAGAGGFDGLATAMGLGAAVAYTGYILVSERVVGEALPPVLLSALVAVGATASFTGTGIVTGSLDTGFAAQGWLWLALIALVSTVAAVLAFFAGLRRVGASSASILSTFEPPVTVGLAFLAFGERLTAVQMAGGALVLAAVVILQARAPRRASVLAAEPAPV